MMYELLTGTVRFSSSSTSELLTKHLNEPIPPLSVQRVTLPGTLDEIIQKATAKEPNQRYPDAPSVAVAFRKAITAVPGPEQAEKQAPVDTASPPRRPPHQDPTCPPRTPKPQRS